MFIPASRTCSSVRAQLLLGGRQPGPVERRPQRPAGEHGLAVDLQGQVVLARVDEGPEAGARLVQHRAVGAEQPHPVEGGVRRGCGATTAPRPAPPARPTRRRPRRRAARPGGCRSAPRPRSRRPPGRAAAPHRQAALVSLHARSQLQLVQRGARAALQRHRPPRPHGGRAGGEARAAPQQHGPKEAQVALGDQLGAPAGPRLAALPQQRGEGEAADVKLVLLAQQRAHVHGVLEEHRLAAQAPARR